MSQMYQWYHSTVTISAGWDRLRVGNSPLWSALESEDNFMLNLDKRLFWHRWAIILWSGWKDLHDNGAKAHLSMHWTAPSRLGLYVKGDKTKPEIWMSSVVQSTTDVSLESTRTAVFRSTTTVKQEVQWDFEYLSVFSKLRPKWPWKSVMQD